MNSKKFVLAILSLSVIFSLTACSSGGDAGTTVAGGGRGGAEFGFLTLSITDAPIDKATEVWVQFDGLELMPKSDSPNQEPILITFDEPMSINLLELQGDKSKTLLSNEILPTGIYSWLNLKVTASNDGLLDSYIKFGDGTVHELDIPSGSEVGLKIKGGLEIIANTSSEKTIDFNLRKSVINTGADEFKLKPTIKLISNNRSGTIEGTIKLKVLTSSRCSDNDPVTGNAVYLYEGKNITPDDIDGIDPEPATSALVKLNNTTGEYVYSFGYVPFGNYTAVFTCEAGLDDPMTNDVINFTITRNVNIKNVGVKTLAKNAFRFRTTIAAVNSNDN